MRKFFFYFVLSFLFIANNSCKRDNLSDSDEGSNNQNNLVKVSAKIILPSGVTLTNAENYTISSVDGDFKIDPKYTIGKSSNTIYACTPEVKTTGGSQLIFLANQVGTPILYGYNTLPTLQDLQTFNGIYLSAQSTAIATLLSYPQLATPYKDVQNGISEEIVKMPSYNSYLNEVIKKIEEVAKIPACVSVDYTALPSYKKVLVEFFNSAIAENFMIMKSNVEYNHISESNGVFKFSVKNKGMRTIDIYANRVYLNNGVPYNKIPIELTENGEQISFDPILLTPRPVNYKDLVWGSLKAYLFGGAYPDYISLNETKEITADVKDAQRLELEVWGIGQPHKSFSEFSELETFRLCQVSMEAGYYDFINPIISLNEGINTKISDVQNINGVFDFRYGSRKQPFKELISKLTKAYLSQPNIKEKLYGYYTKKEYAELIQDMGVFIAKELYTDFDTGGGVKYLNYIYNIYKDIAGITKKSEQFRLGFKKCFASLWHWYDLAEKTIKISEASVTLATAINDAYSSKTMVTFTKNISTVPDNPILKDSNDYEYKVIKLNNQWWSAENWREPLSSSQISSNVYYNSNKVYGVYSNNVSPNNLPNGWRLPTKLELQNLVTSLGSNAFNILTQNSASGFNAKPYGYYYEFYGSTFNNFNEIAVFISSDVYSVSVSESRIWCLVINYINQTVEVQSLFWLNGISFYPHYAAYNVRLIRD